MMDRTAQCRHCVVIEDNDKQCNANGDNRSMSEFSTHKSSKHVLRIACVGHIRDGSGLTSMWGWAIRGCMTSACLPSVQLHRPSVSPQALSQHELPHTIAPTFALLWRHIHSSGSCARVPPVGGSRSAGCHRNRRPLPAPRRATTTPVRLRRAYAHYCTLPSLVAPPLYTTQPFLQVRRASRRHNGLSRHIPCHLRLRAPERQ